MSIIVSLLIFGIVIIVHEFGHFITAVKSGIKVEEFAIGMGPLIWSKQGKETLYSVRLFPIGGYCKMEGEDQANMSPSSFNSKSVWARMWVISGGVIMNTILAFIIFFSINLYTGFREVVVHSVIEGYPAEAAGLQPGDEIYSVDGYKVETQEELSLRLSDASTEDLAKGEEPVIDLIYKREGEKYQVEMPLMKDIATGRYIIGFNVSAKTGVLGEEVEGFEKATLIETVDSAIDDMFFVVESTIYGLRNLFTQSNPVQQVAGPIGIIGAIGSTYEETVETSGAGLALLNMVYIMGLISANLAVFNLLPIPALDGGRLVFLFIEAVTGKRVPPDKEGFVHFVGFVVLMAFALVVAFSDIYKLF